MRQINPRFSILPSAVILLLLVLTTIPQKAAAQSFQKGLNQYEQGNYSEAATIFSNIDTEKARLFAGKAYFGMGQYLTAKSYLGQVGSDSPEDLYLDAQYTLALTDFQLGLFGDALNRLYPMKKQEVKTQTVTNGIQLYEDIMGYLTLNQRKNAFQEANNPQIKYDLVASAFGNVSYPVAQTLYEQLVKSKIDTSSSAMRELSSSISDSLNYAVEMAYNSKLQAPDGITYNIGAALPSYPNDAPEFKVSQGLYFGYVLAAEDFNQQHTNKKAFIRYQNTGAKLDSAGFAMTNLAWNYNADAVLGPLFSEPARKMADLSEQYQIPMIAPLANSDTLNIDNPYVYQANPTFTSHGRRMAEYAVQELQMDTLAVLTEKNSLGESSAYAFRDRAEKLGAKVTHFFVDNLESQGYEITDYTKYFTTDSAKIESLGNYHYLDAVYAPFTGQAASTLAELLLVDLKAMNSNLTVLGSQEWGNFELAETQRGNRNIYFSESFYMDQKSQRLKQFKERFKRRFDMEPNRFAMIGYDAASYLLETLHTIGNPALLKDALKNQPMYEGLISNIDFKGTHINQEVKIFEITDNGIQPVLK
ncbi:MAG: ABC transporter substrate-binding protein [Fodinibius sp.]|nr:ABC transporter substrate-binding protein [Fodinibius sp.]